MSPNSTIAAGNHAIDGIVMRLVTIAPTAERRMRLRAMSAPSAVPITTAIAKPMIARCSV